MTARWLLLIHQLPPTPPYLRVKVARRMQRIGAVAIKNTVYVLPAAENTLEDFQWTVREIRAGGGEANVFEARVVEGLTDAEIQQLFTSVRDDDYARLAEEAKALLKAASRKKRAGAPLGAELQQLRERMAEIQAIDYFGAAKGQVVAALLDQVAGRLAGAPPAPPRRPPAAYRGRTWVTRTGVHVDRMSSAWLIRRFIDGDAKFKFVQGKQYTPQPGEVRFDMFDAEFTHEGDRCTFEVLADRMGIDDPAVRAIGELVHDIDLKETKFNRPETPGVALLINGMAMAHHGDEERLARAASVLEDLYVVYQKKR
ncbi:MAG TPA: chromate resistance protein ChrB domain-containing protein [Thermoanaerobaculia bacterium]|nr:chromate resistance protein ChrB domain-containing protein [Thermoanaerobaculia bacterium]